MLSRYLTGPIRKDLRKKMVLLSGPRQSGKTTLARSLEPQRGLYLNWDIRAHQKVIRDAAWPKDAALVVLDELHKYMKWKNFLKGIADEFKNKPPLLVTGSARLETLKHAGDALTGRAFPYRLHPIDLAETKHFHTGQSVETRFDALLKTGGFPEAFLNPADAERLRNGRFDVILNEDLRDVSQTSAVRGIQLLIELLRERVGGSLNYANLAQDIGVAPATVKAWIELLERLYVIFILPPYSTGLARSLRKEPKVYFYDGAAAYNGPGAVLENTVACALLKFCHFHRDVNGRPLGLFYFRDKEKREVDFVVTLNRRPFWCLEVKTGEDAPSPALAYLNRKLRPRESLQLVKNLSMPREVNGVKTIPLAPWLDRLDDPGLLPQTP